MDRKLFKMQEALGILVSGILTVLFGNLYDLLRGNPLGVIFGSVNASIWEQLKAVILGYVVFGLFQLLTSKPCFRHFIIGKATGLYIVIAMYVILRYAISPFYNTYINLLLIAIVYACGYLVSYLFTMLRSDMRDLFVPACFMLLLIFVMFFSFTVFPPKLTLFQDPTTGLYGIIPDYIDTGAMVLNQFN